MKPLWPWSLWDLDPWKTKLLPLLVTHFYLVIMAAVRVRLFPEGNETAMCVLLEGKGENYLRFLLCSKSHSLLVPMFKGWNFFASCTGLGVTLSAKSAEA